MACPSNIKNKTMADLTFFYLPALSSDECCFNKLKHGSISLKIWSAARWTNILAIKVQPWRECERVICSQHQNQTEDQLQVSIENLGSVIVGFYSFDLVYFQIWYSSYGWFRSIRCFLILTFYAFWFPQLPSFPNCKNELELFLLLLLQDTRQGMEVRLTPNFALWLNIMLPKWQNNLSIILLNDSATAGESFSNIFPTKFGTRLLC